MSSPGPVSSFIMEECDDFAPRPNSRGVGHEGRAAASCSRCGDARREWLRAPGTRGSLSPTPRPLAEQTLDVDEFVAEHNRNAERIQSLEAKPTIGVAGKVMQGTRRRPAGPGTPAQLQARALGWPDADGKADIGSNDEEFWFWVDDDEDKSIYWCNYDELDSSRWPSPISRTGSSKPSA